MAFGSVVHSYVVLMHHFITYTIVTYALEVMIRMYENLTLSISV